MIVTPSSTLPVAVIGAGPVGLAAAAHLVARRIPFVVFEAGPGPGHHFSTYRHVRLFSPWRFNVDRAAVRLLSGAGWTEPDPDRLPTAGEVVDDYLVPLARHREIADRMHWNARVIAVSRRGHDKVKSERRGEAPFILQAMIAGRIQEYEAAAVLDASGTWARPNPTGAHGLPAIGEREHASRITYGMPDVASASRARYANRKVLVVGAGHSAIGTLIALADLAGQEPRTRIAWALRRKDLRTVLGGGTNDGLPARGALGLRLARLLDENRLAVHRGFCVKRIEEHDGRLRVTADDQTLEAIEEVDEIVVATGSRPDLEMVRELRLRFDPMLESTEVLAPLIDPNVHSCGTVRPHGHRELEHPEPGFYAIGAKSYGRAPNFLMATGYEQARSVVAAIAGDLAAADDVQLVLPQTGVCSSDFEVDDRGRIVDCCGGPAEQPAAACCVADERAKASGAGGCGCSASAPAAAVEPRTRALVLELADITSTERGACCAPVK